MRIVIATLAVLTAGGALDTANADPYRWCAQYSGRGGATNCYFVTWEQCQAAVSGVGGFCRVNTFYTGPDAPPRRSRRHT
jgi:hypothetical protein